jgi:hypothetical protein
LAALAPLADLDANFDFRAGSLTFNRQPVRGLHLQGTLFGGKLTIADASAQDIGGGQGKISGRNGISFNKGVAKFNIVFALGAIPEMTQ